MDQGHCGHTAQCCSQVAIVTGMQLDLLSYNSDFISFLKM